jgi:hypothetical protein
MSELYVPGEEQADAVRLLSLPVLLNCGMNMGPKTQATLERFRDHPPEDETPMEWAHRVYRSRYVPNRAS